MELRKLERGDLESFYECRLRALQTDPDAFLVTIDEERAGGTAFFESVLSAESVDNVIFGAVDRGRLVGTAGIYRESRTKSRHKAVIWGMFVDPASRGMGVGKKLLDLAVRHARDEMKAAVVYLTVESGNQAAQALYRSRGFRKWGEEPKAMCLDGRYFGEHHMTLDLGN